MIFMLYKLVLTYNSYDSLETSRDNIARGGVRKENLTCQNSSIKEYKAAGVCR